MPVTVRVPTPLRKLAQDQAEVQLEATSVAELLDALEASFGGIKARLCDESGKLRRFVNIYVNEEDIRFLQAEATPLEDGARVTIVQTISGG